MTLYRNLDKNYPEIDHLFHYIRFNRLANDLGFRYFFRNVNAFSKNLIITNKYDELPKLKGFMNRFQFNMTSCIPLLFANYSFFKIENYIEEKYLKKTDYKFPLVDAVIFVPEDKMIIIKKEAINNGKKGKKEKDRDKIDYYEDPLFRELKNKKFDEYEHEFDENNLENSKIYRKPKFNEPTGEPFDENVHLTSMNLAGLATKMTLREMYNKVSSHPMYKTIFVNGKEITSSKSKLLEDEKEYNVVILCEETLKGLAVSFSKDPNSKNYKNIIKTRFNVEVDDDYFNYEKELEITFAHEVGHILLGHLEGTTEQWINRETQTNFLASIMLNDKIDSIYMQYETNFQPREYQRTMLFHNDFDSTNFTEAFIKMIKLK